MGDILDYLGVHGVITGVLMRRGQEDQSQRCDNGSREQSDNIARKRPCAREASSSRKRQGSGFSPPKVHSLADSFWNADPQKYKRMNLFCFKPLNLW